MCVVFVGFKFCSPRYLQTETIDVAVGVQETMEGGGYYKVEENLLSDLYDL